MNIGVNIPAFSKSKEFFPDGPFFRERWDLFKKIIESEETGFFHVNKDENLLKESIRIFDLFKHKKYFVHVGIGGSSLGAETLVQSLGKRPFRNKIFFLNNVDPDATHDILEQIDVKETLFYFVSKSGGTAETLAGLALIINYLKEKGIKSEELRDSLVFATDPEEGDLKEMANALNLETLTIPKNIGGRFSVLTPVAFLPSLFASIDIKALCRGAEMIKKRLLEENFEKNILLKCASFLYFLKKDQNINQTVLMPYSSKLKSFSQWFVQLWAESLGKRDSYYKKNVFEGLTPLGAYGVTDQHSQMQLFMEGPRDKCLVIIEIEHFKEDFKLQNSFSQKALKKLNHHSLGGLLKAELKGTLKALETERRPFIHLSLKELNEESLGSLFLFFQSLTVLMGNFLDINPFNQPGVEMGKKFSFEFLSQVSPSPE
jgi:glucose-6-phosphate isomerase